VKHVAVVFPSASTAFQAVRNSATKTLMNLLPRMNGYFSKNFPKTEQPILRHTMMNKY